MSRLPARIYHAARGLPPVTGALLAAISVVFALETAAGGSANANTLIAFGASLRPYFMHGEYWRLVLPMFIHLSIVHLLLNAAALVVFCPPLERVYGGRRFALIYLAGGMGGSLASMLLSRQIGAGASGAILGVCGALAVTGYLRPEALTVELRPKCREQTLAAIVLTLAVGVWIPHIDNFAHLGGLIAGGAVALVLPPPGALERIAPRLGWKLMLPLCVVCFSMCGAINYYGLSREVNGLETAGHELLAHGRIKTAARRFEQAALIEPADERSYDALGKIYVREQQWQTAIAEYQQALNVTQDPSAARVRLAAAYIESGNIREGERLIRRAVRHPHKARDHEAVALLLMQEKLYPEAIREHEAALRLYPDWPAALNNLAWLYARVPVGPFHQPEEAERLAQKAVTLTRWKDPNYIDTLAEAHFAAGDARGAAVVERVAVQKAPHEKQYEQHLKHFLRASTRPN